MMTSRQFLGGLLLLMAIASSLVVVDGFVINSRGLQVPASSSIAGRYATTPHPATTTTNYISTRRWKTKKITTTSSLSSSSSDAPEQINGDTSESFVRNPVSILASFWGMGGLLSLLLVALKYTVPSALEPLLRGGGLGFFSPLQWCAYVASIVIIAYGQGNKCIQRKFAPLVVKRACTIDTNYKSNGFFRYLFAPLYSMGLLTATKERLIKSYSLVFGTAALQVAVHRNMIPLLSSVNHPKLLSIWNAGFAAGFGWGALSLVYLYLTCLKTGTTPKYDKCLPKK